MQFRCPYCKEPLGDEPAAVCPHCHRTAVVPARYRTTSARERKKAMDKIAAEANRKRRSLRGPEPGFGRNPSTLFIIISILAMVGALLIVRSREAFTPPPQPDLELRAEMELDTLSTALAMFKDDCGRYPTTGEGLDALLQSPGIDGWDGHYINLLKSDPWNQPYRYTVTKEQFTLFSCGPDTAANTPDDISPP